MRGACRPCSAGDLASIAGLRYSIREWNFPVLSRHYQTMLTIAHIQKASLGLEVAAYSNRRRSESLASVHIHKARMHCGE
jgi:hypothetical protein